MVERRRCTFVLPAFVQEKWKEHSPLYTQNKRANDRRRWLAFLTFFCTLLFAGGSEQIVAQDQAEKNDADGKKAVGDKKHDSHADADPKQDESEKFFHNRLSLPVQQLLLFYSFSQKT